VHGLQREQRNPEAIRNRRWYLSFIDTLIDIKVRCVLCCQIHGWLDLDTLVHMRIAVHSQRRAACQTVTAPMAGLVQVNRNPLQLLLVFMYISA
jgi:hypothetical protein